MLKLVLQLLIACACFLTGLKFPSKDSLVVSEASASSIQLTLKRSLKQELMLLLLTLASEPQYEPQEDSVGLEAPSAYTPGMLMSSNMLPLSQDTR